MNEDPETRSRIMRAVKGEDTTPELIVRRLVFSMGYRYRLHRKDLPGTPDLVFPRLRKVIFVHGCFWHGHDCPRGARVPVHNQDYWVRKIARNTARDGRVRSALGELGWKCSVIWECDMKDRNRLSACIRTFLENQ